ncbi:MAG TPA: EVE domain-containing protein [Methanocorpusculum sp.]|nr:EVE domain-containing protein [Methanocorpusculum sp.]
MSDTEIGKCHDINIKQINVSKIKAYPSLDDYPDPYKNNDNDFLNIVDKNRNANENDMNDNIILYSVYKNAVSLLISNDSRLIKKSKKFTQSLNIDTVEEALEYFKTLFPESKKISVPIGIQDKKMFNVDINDPLFDTLKQDYGDEFKSWFKKKSEEGRDCYVSYKQDEMSLGSFMAYKDETEIIYCKPEDLPLKRRFKISTLKVCNTGLRIGEALINIAIRNALINGINEIYLTHFTEPESDGLVALIKRHGFYCYGYDDKKYPGRKEDIYIKKLRPDEGHICLTPYEDDVKYYPSFYDGDKVNKYIIPILPEFHDRLFLDSERQTTLLEHMGEHSVEGYAILKAYLTNSKIKKIRPGDIVIFYKSGGVSCITKICVVDDVFRNLTDTDKINNIIRKRTVYSLDEVENIKKPITAILFRYNININKKVDLKLLTEHNILNGAPQSITQINEDRYRRLMSVGVIDESLTFH